MHGVWDQSYGWAILVTKGFVARGGRWSGPTPGVVGARTEGSCSRSECLRRVAAAENAVIGVAWIIHNWRKYGAAASAAEREARLPSGGPDAVTPRAGT